MNKWSSMESSPLPVDLQIVNPCNSIVKFSEAIYMIDASWISSPQPQIISGLIVVDSLYGARQMKL